MVWKTQRFVGKDILRGECLRWWRGGGECESKGEEEVVVW